MEPLGTETGQSRPWQDNVTFVLVGTLEPGNIGMCARAMKNMGFSRLRLVDPPPEDLLESKAKWFAISALDVLENATVFPDLDAAIADQAFVVGTTRRRGRKRGATMWLRDWVAEIRAKAELNPVAIVFGNERTGLTNEDADRCGLLVSIPTFGEQPSLSLPQALMVTSYELALCDPPERSLGNGRMLVTQAEMDELWGLLEEVMPRLDMDRRGNFELGSNAVASFRHFIGRAGLAKRELQMLVGLCWRIRNRLPLPEGQDKTTPEGDPPC